MKQLSAIDQVLQYHEVSKHHYHRYAPSPGFLDWDSQPDPFRHWHNAPRYPLPLNPDPASPGYHDIYRQTPPAMAWQLNHLSEFLQLAMGLSAWKTHGPDRWALRNNPSSGNLHPTELYIVLWRPDMTEIPAGLFHYDCYRHALEQRASLSAASQATLNELYPDSYAAIALSSIIWREEWKYGSRAYRYCQLDVGHALGSCRFAAANFGWTLQLDPRPGDDQLTDLLGLGREQDFAGVEPEQPECVALLGCKPTQPMDWPAIALDNWQGQASRISHERIRWPQIQQMLTACHKPPMAEFSRYQAPARSEPAASDTELPLADVIRRRRSAQRMDRNGTIEFEAFSRMLTRTIPAADTPPMDVFTFAPAIDLIIFAHGVSGLQPGKYVCCRNPDEPSSLLQHLRDASVPVVPVRQGNLLLHRIGDSSDVRRDIGRLSCHQGIASQGAFALAMLADIGATIRQQGAWSWRRLFWEAGLIGQLLYLEAEASGLNGTGIGCFFDDEVLRLLGLPVNDRYDYQVLYHFTVGKAKEDTRLSMEAAYTHLLADGENKR